MTVGRQNLPRRTARGLYDPRWEHDACGVGAVVNIGGTADHLIVDYARQILLNLQHRGAGGGDGITGDGAGILIQIPHEFFVAQAEALGVSLPSAGAYAVAMVFLPRQQQLQQRCCQLLAEALEHHGLRIAAWRDVPVRNDCLGDLARSAEPVIRQALIDGCGRSGEHLERKCFLARKRTERLVRERLEEADDFYVASMSCRTVVYKGMFLAPQLFAYYPDLSDERVKTCLAVVHQRYSTNTLPNWKLAQPFRLVAHNGEINTLSGNRNHMRAREPQLACEAFGDDLTDLLPVLDPQGSDSACFDNALELLVRAGRSLPHAAMMMVPEAFGAMYHISTDKRSFYEYHAAIMEPWDGPAAMVFSDGRCVGATLDRNGLRPCRYVVTTDGLAILASQIGVLDLPPQRIARKGRLQPGRMFLVDTVERRIISDNEIKSRIARSRPYRRWLEQNRIELRGLLANVRPPEPDTENLPQRRRDFGAGRASSSNRASRAR